MANAFSEEQVTHIIGQATTPAQRAELQRALGVDVDVSVADQIAGKAALKEHKEREYVTTPNVRLSDRGAKGVFIRKEVAKVTAMELLRFCDENGL